LLNSASTVSTVESGIFRERVGAVIGAAP
jgi:hypothetical protein